MKEADFMDNSTKIPLPSMKHDTSMDKSLDPGSTGTKQALVSASHAARQKIPLTKNLLQPPHQKIPQTKMARTDQSLPH